MKDSMKLAREIHNKCQHDEIEYVICEDCLAKAIDKVRLDTIEECAKTAEMVSLRRTDDITGMAGEIAKTIRSLGGER